MTSIVPETIPEHCNFATDVIDKWAEDPTRTALLWEDPETKAGARIAFAEVRDKSLGIARALQAAGLRKGDAVAIVMGRQPAWWHAMTGMIRAGIVAIPGTALLSQKDLRFRIEKANVRGIIADNASADRVDQIRGEFPGLKMFWVAGEARPGWMAIDEVYETPAAFEPVKTRSDELMLIYFTSGTAGHPKMVQHTYASYYFGHCVTGKLWLNLRADDVHFNLSDTGWGKAAYSSFFGPWIQGAAIFAQHDPGFHPRSILQALKRHSITTFCAPPTAFRQLIAQDPELMKLPSLRRCHSAGEPLNPEVFHAWKELTGLPIHEAYGQTETTPLIASLEEDPIRPGWMGKATPGYEIDLVDGDLRPVPDGEAGEIAVRVQPKRPVGLFAGYKDNPEENAEKFRGPYYLTGDLAVRDKDGYYQFMGRGDDVIKSSGYRVGPFEVESALIEHPAVMESAVVASPDPKRYQIVKAFVILHSGYEPSAALARQLQKHVRNTIAPYKTPREIEFVESLPKTISGKIRRVELRQNEERRKRAAQVAR